MPSASVKTTSNNTATKDKENSKSVGTTLIGFRVTNSTSGSKPVRGLGVCRNIPPGESVFLTQEEFVLAQSDIDAKPYLTVEEEKQ